jgi:hypothetical protein
VLTVVDTVGKFRKEPIGLNQADSQSPADIRVDATTNDRRKSVPSAGRSQRETAGVKRSAGMGWPRWFLTVCMAGRTLAKGMEYNWTSGGG